MKPWANKFFLLIILFVLVFYAQAVAQHMLVDVKIAGHRGGYYYEHPESSLTLFGSIAKKFKSDTIIVELDLRKSKKGTIYIMHDETVDRTTNGKGKVDQLEDTYLNGLYLKKENGEITRTRIPTFEDVLTYIKKKNINLMLDIKITIHAEAYTLIKKRKMENRMMTLTFNMDLTKKVAALSDQILLSALIESKNDWHQFKDILMPAGKKIAYINSKTPPALIQELKKNKIKVMMDVSEALRNSGKPLEEAGYQNKVTENSLDILITDFPIEAWRAMLKK